MTQKDLFSDDNIYYKNSSENPFEIIPPHGRDFFHQIIQEKQNLQQSRIRSSNLNIKNNNSNVHSKQNECNDIDIEEIKENESSKEEEVESDEQQNKEKKKKNQDYQFKSAPRELSLILKDKVNQLEKISYNKVSQRSTDFNFLKLLHPQHIEKSISVISDYEFSLVARSLSREERIKQVSAILNKVNILHLCHYVFWISMEELNLKAVKLLGLLRCQANFLEKKSQLSTYYHVFGCFENSEYSTILKSEVENVLTTSIMSLWLQASSFDSRIPSDATTYHVGMADRSSSKYLRTYIENVQKQIEEADENFEGFDLYLGLRRCASIEGYIEQEIECWKWLLVDLILICMTLGDRQNCIIKFYHCFSAKTLQILYLFSKAFQTTIMLKPAGSSLASNQRYLICTGFKRNFGRQLGEILLTSYSEFSEELNLFFDLKTLTQDLKFYTSFIDKFLKNLLRLQVEYYRCNVVFTEKKYREVFKIELKSVFEDPICVDRIKEFETTDFQLSRELGITYVNYDGIDEKTLQFKKNNKDRNTRKQIQAEKRQNQKKLHKFRDFSDEEEAEDSSEEDNSDQESNLYNKNRKSNSNGGILNEFIKFSKNKLREDNEIEQQARNKTYNINNEHAIGNDFDSQELNGYYRQENQSNHSRKRKAHNVNNVDEIIINEREERDLDFSNDLLRSMCLFISDGSLKKKKKIKPNS